MNPTEKLVAIKPTTTVASTPNLYLKANQDMKIELDHFYRITLNIFRDVFFQHGLNVNDNLKDNTILSQFMWQTVQVFTQPPGWFNNNQGNGIVSWFAPDEQEAFMQLKAGLLEIESFPALDFSEIIKYYSTNQNLINHNEDFFQIICGRSCAQFKEDLIKKIANSPLENMCWILPNETKLLSNIYNATLQLFYNNITEKLDFMDSALMLVQNIYGQEELLESGDFMESALIPVHKYENLNYFMWKVSEWLIHHSPILDAKEETRPLYKVVKLYYTNNQYGDLLGYPSDFFDIHFQDSLGVVTDTLSQLIATLNKFSQDQIRHHASVITAPQKLEKTYANIISIFTKASDIFDDNNITINQIWLEKSKINQLLWNLVFSADKSYKHKYNSKQQEQEYYNRFIAIDPQQQKYFSKIIELFANDIVELFMLYEATRKYPESDQSKDFFQVFFDKDINIFINDLKETLSNRKHTEFKPLPEICQPKQKQQLETAFSSIIKSIIEVFLENDIYMMDQVFPQDYLLSKLMWQIIKSVGGQENFGPLPNTDYEKIKNYLLENKHFIAAVKQYQSYQSEHNLPGYPRNFFYVLFQKEIGAEYLRLELYLLQSKKPQNLAETIYSEIEKPELSLFYHNYFIAIFASSFEGEFFEKWDFFAHSLESINQFMWNLTSTTVAINPYKLQNNIEAIPKEIGAILLQSNDFIKIIKRYHIFNRYYQWPGYKEGADFFKMYFNTSLADFSKDLKAKYQAYIQSQPIYEKLINIFSEELSQHKIKNPVFFEQSDNIDQLNKFLWSLLATINSSYQSHNSIFAPEYQSCFKEITKKLTANPQNFLNIVK